MSAYRLRTGLGAALALATLLLITQRRAPATVLAYTTCPFRGAPHVVMNSGIDAADTMPVRVHEEVHAQQCRELGPFRYRWQNLSSSGKLALELPAYCAAAAARVRRGDSRKLVLERLKDDVDAAFLGTVDSLVIRERLAAACRTVAASAVNQWAGALRSAA